MYSMWFIQEAVASDRKHKVPRWEKPRIIYYPAHRVLVALNQAQKAVSQLWHEQATSQGGASETASAEERRSELHLDMTGIISQLTDLAQTIHEQTKKLAEYMEKSKQWLISRN